MSLNFDGQPVPTPPGLTLDQEREWHNSIAGQANRAAAHYGLKAKMGAGRERQIAAIRHDAARWLHKHHAEAARQCGKMMIETGEC